MYFTHLLGEAQDNNVEALAVSLDVSKAYYRVWHASLISQFPAYGLSLGLIGWVKYFLGRRFLQVVVEGCTSETMATCAEVPQGFVLSATLFLLNSKDLLMTSIYEDDSTIMERCQSIRTSNDLIQYKREAVVERVYLAL